MPGVGWASTDTGFYYVVLGCTLLIALLVVLIVHSRLGRLLRGISDSAIALSANGATVNMTHVLVFCISAFIAGISGALLGGDARVDQRGSFDPIASLDLLSAHRDIGRRCAWYA